MVEANWYTISLIIFSLLLLFFKLFLGKQKIYKNLPPSPPGLPILGHLHLLKEPLYQTFQAFSDKYGPIILLRFGPRNVLVVNSPSAVEECFTKNDVIFANRPPSLHSKHLSYNSTTIAAAPYGDLWRNLRMSRKLFRHLVREHLEFVKTSDPSDLFPVLQKVDLFGTGRKMVASAEKMDKFLQNLVDERRRMDASTKMKKTLIDSLLSLQEAEPEFYTNNIINGVILILLIAGTETSSTAMEWAMSLLLNHPNAMTKVRAEIEAHVGQNHLLDEQDLPKLNYLCNVVKETLRLYSPAPILVPHAASEDCIVGGYDVPQGTMLMVNVLAIHRDPKLWENPTTFMPERFEEENSGDGYKWIPFGCGRRGCPGANLANRMVGLTLGALIQSFEWNRVDEEEVDMTENFGFSMPKLKPLEKNCGGGYSKVDLKSKFFEEVEDVEEAKFFQNLMREHFELANASNPADIFWSCNGWICLGRRENWWPWQRR
ncbi:hypothetical protein HYC85_020044 [Camellia sinensis]|uniref:Cytochrome P450 n=1 Tax=Camellia sinensis TaxID=4442 RepID=A0A7J7GNN2_CAMSI|nr:hypothetical protein HYC85_020044 [Camellia sinensis]